jgi:hypothetical protein
VKCVEWIVTHGASINAIELRTGRTALHLAMLHGRVGAAHSLIRLGAQYLEDNDGNLPVSLADTLKFRAFTEAASAPELPRFQQVTSLDAALTKRDWSLCKQMVKDMPGIKSRKMLCGCTPLIKALQVGFPKADLLQFFFDGASQMTRCIYQFHQQSLVLKIPGRAIDIVIMDRYFDDILSEFLESCLDYQEHWLTDSSQPWTLFHIAAAVNPGAIQILASHLRRHEALFR